MTNTSHFRSLLKRQVALPQDHGSWVFLLSPLFIGLFTSEDFSRASFYLIAAALAAFLVRQPITIAVKVYSGRRASRDLPAARFWTITYLAIGGLALLGLILEGYAFVLLLALPGIPVFIWHLYLVSRRAERRQAGVEIIASGTLALAAPGAYWVGQGQIDPTGWWLFFLCWFQSAASIVYAYLRLSQRELPQAPATAIRIRIAWRALLYTTFNLAVVLGFSIAGRLPSLLPIPYAVQWVETVWGAINPAIGIKPTSIGLRQLTVSSLFTVLFILAWNAG